MKIYTKTGDEGFTGLFGGERVLKDSPRIEAYGEVDELNSAIGAVRASSNLPHDLNEFLQSVQSDLFVLGADLATPSHKERKNITIPRVTPEMVTCLEAAIDQFEAELPPLKNFILPGGTFSGSLVHLSRGIARRAERRIVALYSVEPEIGLLPVQFVNRLSDLLFVLARVINHRSGSVEQPWNPRS